MTEPDVANDKDLDDGFAKNGRKSKEESSKNKRNAKKKKTTDSESEEDEEVEVPPSKTKRGDQKGDKNSSKDTADPDTNSKKEKVPLLDQPTIVEGSRNRKTVVQFESKVTVTKFSPVEIPKGKGTPLGRIPNINGRMKRLRQNVLKEFHKFLFGKCGNPANFIVNLQKFCGFSIEKESDPYNRKLFLLHKFPINDIKELLYFLDLDLKYKKKDEAVRRVLDFLISPDISNTEQTPQPTSHPKRRATKRNYEDAEIDEVDMKKKKKQPIVLKSASEDSDTGKVEEDSKSKSRRRTKNSSESETNTVDEEDSQKDESDAEDENDEMKKPAKKRKRQQINEESEETAKETKNQKKKLTGKQKKKKKRKQDEETTKSESEVSGEEEEIEEQKKTDLSDEELKSFLQSVLANANLEETTMKTVYGLINTHYPEYNFSKKKDFIKDIVKSLLQSS